MVSVRGQDAPESGDPSGVLEGGMVGQGAVQVTLDLVRGQVALTHRLLHQAGVVTLVRRQLRGRVCRKRRRQIAVKIKSQLKSLAETCES